MPSTDWFAQAVFTWVSQNATVFLPDAWNLYRSVAVIYVMWFGAVFSFDALMGFRHQAAVSGVKVIVLLSLVGFSLRFYAVPTPVLGNLSLHQVFPEIGRYLANVLNTTSMNQCVQQLDALLNAQTPPTWHSPWLEMISYAVLVGLTWMLQGLMFLLAIVGYVYLAVGIVFGPLLLCCSLIPIRWVQGLAGDWFRYMLNWSMFLPVAAALVSVWSSMMLFVLQAMFHGAYNNVELLVAVRLLIVANMAFWYLAWRVEHLSGALFGVTGMAAGFGDFLRGSFI